MDNRLVPNINVTLKYCGRIDSCEELKKLSEHALPGEYVLNVTDSSMYLFNGIDWIKDPWDYDETLQDYSKNSPSKNKNNIAKAKLVSYILKNGYNEELGQILESL